MKYLKTLQQKRVFDLAFAVSLTNNEKTAKSMLQSYKKAGVIKSVRQNLYVTVDLSSGNSLAGRFEIGSSINKDAYISHHSALEFHGVANQVFHQVTVTSNTRFRPFEYDDFSYERYSERIHSGVITPPLSPLVRVTDLERTVIDCLYDIDLAGGLEEIIEALTLIPTLDEQYLISYLKEYNQIYLWQKAGYVLSHFKESLQISNSFFDECKSHIHNRKQTLVSSYATCFYPEWKLYAPTDLLAITSEGGDALV